MVTNDKARGSYSLVFNIAHNKKTLKIPIYERGEYRYSVDIVTIDYFLFSKEMQSKNKNELRIALLSYVNNLADCLLKNKKQSHLLKQCRELMEELRITNYNFDFYIQGKNKFPILYKPTDLVKYVNEIYAFDEQAVTYNKEKLRNYVFENEEDIQLLVHELFQSLLYDADIYFELLYSEKELSYLMDKIKAYKFYQKNIDSESMEGMNDLHPMIMKELLTYKNLRLILSHPIVLNNGNIKELHKKVQNTKESRVEDTSILATHVEKLWEIYDLHNLPKEQKKFIDGTGKRM